MSSSPASTGKPERPRGFPRLRRLTDKPQFDAAYKGGFRVSDPLFVLVARVNDLGHARLGLSVGVRAAGSAVRRNRLKRLVRESFRHVKLELPAVDLVVNAKPAATAADNQALRDSLARLWRKLGERCARC